jgi:chorismate mutase
LTDDTTRAAALLAGHRASIDRLDAVLVYTLAERFAHTQAVGRLKAEHALPPSDPDREAQQIARLESLALEAGLDPVFAKKFLGFVIEEVIRHHKRHQPDDATSSTNA